MNIIYLNKLCYNNLKRFPLKLQIFFILKFSILYHEDDMNYLIRLIKKYNDSDNIGNNIIFPIIDAYNYEVLGIVMNSKISNSFIKSDYVQFWESILDSTYNRTNKYFSGNYSDIPFDVILLICEKFNVCISAHHISKFIKLNGYNEDTGLYMIKSKNIKFKNIKNSDQLMNILELMYDDAIIKSYNVLAKIIRTIPKFVASLNEHKIFNILLREPECLSYNLINKPLTFKLLNSENDILSVKLRHLSYDDTYEEFKNNNKLMNIILTNKLLLPLNESYNQHFYNYVFQAREDLLLENKEYNKETNYCEELLKLHLEIMGKPIKINN